MAPIPLTLVGILPAHGALGAFFTATSMIGFIAGAGIIVRNSIILVDFIELRVRQGMPLDEAVIDAGAVRFRPMLLTAAAVVVGAGVILFDPIFQGLAISLMAGEIASTLLSRMAVPVLYYMVNARAARGAAGPTPVAPRRQERAGVSRAGSAKCQVGIAEWGSVRRDLCGLYGLYGLYGLCVLFVLFRRKTWQQTKQQRQRSALEAAPGAWTARSV